MARETEILKRVGAVLVWVGSLDIALMIYCIAKGFSYSSSFNIFAVVAGVFLLRASLRAASVIRRFSLMILTFLGGAFIVLLFVQPMGLFLTELRLDPGASLAAAAQIALAFVLLFWIVRELGREPVLAAIDDEGLKPLDIRKPIAIGVAAAIVLAILFTFLFTGRSAERAKSIAGQQYGPGYRYTVSSLFINSNNKGTFVSGVVTAWNDREIRKIPVHFQE